MKSAGKRVTPKQVTEWAEKSDAYYIVFKIGNDIRALFGVNAWKHIELAHLVVNILQNMLDQPAFKNTLHEDNRKVYNQIADLLEKQIRIDELREHTEKLMQKEISRI